MRTFGRRKSAGGGDWKAAAARAAAALWPGPRPGLAAVAAGRRADAPRPVERLEPRCLLSGAPLITEFVAVNNTGLADENGDRSDWIELFNPAAGDVNLDGYFLTDAAGDRTRWRLPAVTLPSGGYLTVFADGKDRRAAGAPLHTNFSLAGEGGYLALVGPDGSTVLSEYDYPQQVADLSYGVSVTQTVTTLVGPAALARVLVPTDGSLGTAWRAPGFDHAGWAAGPTGVGYETDPAQPPTPGFAVRMVDTNGGTDGDLGGLSEAIGLLDGTAAAGAFNVAFDQTVGRPRIDFGEGGTFNNTVAFPNGATDQNAPGRTQYAMRVTARVTIPAGQYTISAASDDGFRLRIPGVSFTSRSNESYSGYSGGTAADALVFGGPRGITNTFGTFTVPTGGLTTTLHLDSYEGAGGDGLELSLATGQRTSVGTPAFQLLQDGLYGWAVKDPSAAPPPNYRSLIGTDVQAQMRNARNTAYVRVPFAVNAPDDFQSARVRVKYDDGFVAYLNGQEVARRNAPAAPAWDSAATAAHPDADALAFESFAVPVAALVQGANVLAIHGLNAAADQDDFLIAPEVQGLFTSAAGQPTYYSAPTPGAANGATTTVGFVADTKFTVGRGFFAGPFQLGISTATLGATIRYTTNGTAPTATTGTVYAGPITINGTTTVRAAAFKAGLQPANVDTQTYVFMADVIRQSTTTPPPGFPTGTVNGQQFNYGMTQSVVNANPNFVTNMQAIPSVSLVMDPRDLFDAGTGIYTNAENRGRAWERPTSVEFLYPDGTKENLQSNAGLRIRGGFSRTDDNPKHGFRLYFRGEYGDNKFDHPIFGPTGDDSYDQFDLRTFQNYSWSFQGDSRFTGLRDQFARDTQLAMGWQGERGDYYNLYINGQYWGIYNTAERTEASFAAANFGGSPDDYDVVKVAPDTGYNIEVTDGNVDAWASLWSQALGDMTSTANYQKLLGNNPDGTRNPGYPVLLDPRNLVDYMLVIYYTGNLDGPISKFLGDQSPNNYYAVRNRVANDRGFQFFAHDSEHTFLDVNDDRTGPFPITNTSVSKSNPQWLFQQLVANAEFKQLVADRIQTAFTNGGPLTPAAVSDRMAVRRLQLEQPVWAESARWGDSKRATPFTKADWQAEVDRLFNSYIPQRTGVVLNQFRARGWFPAAGSVTAPTFSRAAGTVPAGTQVTLGNPTNAGTIYYTLDGSDPRLPGGGVAATAQAYAGTPITINQATTIRARVLNGAAWSPLSQATYTLSTAALKVTELMYNPAPPPAGGAYTADDFEFVELFNSGATSIDLSGMRFDSGIGYTFPAGAALAAGARGVVVKNVAAFRSRYGDVPVVLGTFSDKLSDGGELVRLVGAAGQVVAAFTYSDEWYKVTDGGGHALVVWDPAANQANPATLSTAAAWRPGNDLDGRPGAADPGPLPGAVLINEVSTSSDTAGGDWVELHNPTAAAADLSGWFLSDAAADLRKYQIQPGTTIAAGGYLVLYGEGTFGRAGNPGVRTAFGLDGGGDSVHLSSVDAAGNVGGVRTQEDFAAVPEAGVTFGRVPTAGQPAFASLEVPTPGGANGKPRVGPIVINELMYYPLSGQEFIELRNVTNQAVPLYDPARPQNRWRFTNGVDFSFPADASIPALGYALVVGGDPAQFRADNNVPAGVPVFGPYVATDGSNVLANGGERVTLSMPLAPAVGTGVVPYAVIDTIDYGPSAPWPASPAGGGPSLARVTSSEFGDDPANWSAGPTGGTPGRSNTPNAAPAVAPVAGAFVSEGGTYSVNGSFSDADLEPDGSWTATVDFGDGTGPRPLELSGRTFVLRHVYADNNPAGVSAAYAVTVTVTDAAGASSSRSTQVTVRDVPPTLAIGGPPSASAGAEYTLTLTRSADPGVDTVTSWDVNWGDGQIQTVAAGAAGTVKHTYAAPGTFTISAEASDEDGTHAAGNLVTVTVTQTAPPTVEQVTVNDGAGNRSMVNRLAVRFDQPVAADAEAFAIVRRAGTAAGAGPVTATAASPDGGRTWVLTFAGPGIVGGSLPDGVYDLTVVGSRVRAGSASGPTMAADHVATFHRLFGDANNSKSVNNADYGLFRNAFGKPSTDPAYNALFDFDNSGTVNNADYAQFRNRFGTALAY